MKNTSEKKQGFLEGGGEMGELVRNYPWENTIIGTPENWPLSLQTTVGIILHSAFPMFLFYGEDLLCFYNDAYRPSLGNDGKHPLIGKGGKEAWPDIWDFIGPLIEKVMTTGESVWFENQFLPIYRNGKMEDVYWTFSYSPAYGDRGEIAGVFVTCTETTKQVLAAQSREKNQEELLTYFEQSPVAIATISKENLTFRLVNPFYAELVGRKPEELKDRPLLEALPEIEGQGFDKLLNDVIETGTPFISAAVPVVLKRNSILETIYVDLTYQPQYDLQKNIKGVLVVATDVTAQVRSQKELTESKQKLIFAIDATKLGTWELNPATGTFKGNDRLKEWFGLKPEEEIALSLATDVIVEQDRERVLKAIGEALTFQSGGHYDIEYTIKNPESGKETIVRAKGQAQFDDQHKPVTFSGTLQDVTDETLVRQQLAQKVEEQKVILEKIEESEALLNLTRNAVPAMIFYMDNEQRYRSYNGVFMEWFKVNATEAIGKTTREFIGEAAYGKARPYLERAYAGERVSYEMVAPSKMNKNRWLNIVYTPHINNDGKVMGVIVLATDVSQSKEVEISLRNAELFSKNVFYNSPIAKVVLTGEDMVIERINENMLTIFGRDESIIGKPFTEAMPELLNAPLLDRMREVYRTGEAFVMPEEQIRFMRFGKLYAGYYHHIYKPLFSGTGEIYAVMATATEITEQVLARQQIEAKEKELRELIAASPIGICILSGSPVWVEEVNERFLMISGKTRQQFSSAPYWEVMKEVAPMFEAILINVFKTGIKFTSEEHEMTLIRAGKAERIFATFEYIPVFDTENKVSKVILIAVEVSHQVETRKQIEEAVINRTKELAETNLSLRRSNEELEQFAYIASHDLQEPIRKISTFAQMLEHSLKDPGEKTKDYISKIYNSTDRMSKLVRDVLAFSRLKGETQVFETVDLNKLLTVVQTDFEVLIAKKQATVQVSDLPVLQAIPTQMIQLFSNLLSNSLKYTKDGVKPVITISASIATNEKVAKRLILDKNKQYHHIQFSDNGIGFHPEYVERIFKIFQRLHGKTEFEGTGIGLAICLKIVQNHNGHISAAVGENCGAVFNILLPVAQDGIKELNNN